MRFKRLLQLSSGLLFLMLLEVLLQERLELLGSGLVLGVQPRLAICQIRRDFVPLGTLAGALGVNEGPELELTGGEALNHARRRVSPGR